MPERALYGKGPNQFCNVTLDGVDTATSSRRGLSRPHKLACPLERDARIVGVDRECLTIAQHAHTADFIHAQHLRHLLF